MSKTENKIKIIQEIKQIAQLYKTHMVGRTFLYIYDNKAIEVVYRKKDFLHLTGVETVLSANDFYNEAVRGTITHNQIFFSRRHPYDLCKKKISKLSNLPAIINSDLLILENLSTETFKFKFALTELTFTICLSSDRNNDGELMSDYYIARSLRVEDSFNRGENAFEVDFILSKENNEKLYNKIMYSDKNASLTSLPKYIIDKISNNLTQ